LSIVIQNILFLRMINNLLLVKKNLEMIKKPFNI